MNREDRERMVDRLLNEALAPQDVEPRAGIEDRILANLRAQREPRPWWRRQMLWAPALAAAVIALMVGVAIMKRPVQVSPGSRVASREQPRPQTAADVGPQAAVGSEHRATPAPKISAHSRRAAVAAKVEARALARQDVFPSPVPLTAEEQMLLTLSRRNPAQAVLVAREREMEWERVLKNFEEEAAPKPQNAR